MTSLKAAFFIKNVPGWERALRVAAGLLVGGIAYLGGESPWNWLGALLGAELALTGFVGFCPMCALAGRRLDKLGSAP
ncbi:MAG: DUF2892 domain-containing protein [Myxococcales bacterium]